MFRDLKINAHFNERTGYGVHASRFFPELDKLVRPGEDSWGTAHISLLDTVSAQYVKERQPKPSILYNVWESTEQPQGFIDILSLYDQLWVPSEWQRAASIAQGIPEEFIKVVPEGVDPEVYKPVDDGIDAIRAEYHFDFVHVGQWQPRKSTKEIIECWLKAFPADQYPHVRLYLSVDTLFPSDNYKNTEERLQAHGFTDSRIIVVHFEERTAYIRRLQSANVFVSCARSEGWGLPIIEAMACGVPTIVADWSGSTEYAYDALKVRISKLIKPFGIYGDWDVPGQWCEPDWDHLVEILKDSYNNWAFHKGNAFTISNEIRTKFSWKAAAAKAYQVLEELWETVEKPEPAKNVVTSDTITPEREIMAFARKFGFEVTSMKRRSAIFTIDCHPDTPDKMETLIETIKQVKGFNYPVLLSSHMTLPAEVLEMVDFFIYDKKDALSGDDKPIYWRTDGKVMEQKQANIECHALAAVHNVRNAVDFCRGRYDWIYQMTYDTEVDIKQWLDLVHSSDKDLICVAWEGQKETISGQITAARTEVMDKILPRLETWEDFVKMYGDDRFCSEKGYYKIIAEKVGLQNVEFLNISVGNRFNQVDKNVWKDDIFQCHFVDGAFLNIVGISEREYDVSYTSPGKGTLYQLRQKVGMWSRPSIKYFQDWTVSAYLNGELKYEHRMDLKGQRVLIFFSSKALGDTLAWIPYVEAFRKKHDCHVICSCWWSEIFDYPEIEFVKPGTGVENVYASYEVGCFDNQLDRNVFDWRRTPLQKVASDILGLEYEPLRAQLKYTKPKRGNGNEPKPYICFSEFSTMRNKFWNREGAWQTVINHLINEGYDCISVSSEKTGVVGAISHNGQLIQDTINDISGADFYIGLNAGPTWVAYSLGIPCIMITGVSEEWNDFPNPHRVSIDIGCVPCFNNTNFPINRGWEWCPSNRNYECTAKITPEMVIEHIEQIRGDKNETRKPEVREKKEVGVAADFEELSGELCPPVPLGLSTEI